MSGTSGDGVDASIINSNGIDNYEVLENKYFEYSDEIYDEVHKLKEKIFSIKDLKVHFKEIISLERKITLFHAKIVEEFKKYNNFLVSFHGQTLFHNPKEKISKQLGDGNLLHQLTKKKIVYNFRENDILNGGDGAPLTPIFHQLITTKKKVQTPVCILNIGGITNITFVEEPTGGNNIRSKDIGPGNCLVDNWVRKNSRKKFDKDGYLASIGKKNEIIFEQAQELYANRINKNQISFDINDFDISFVRGLSLEDGAATLTDFTASIIGDEINLFLKKYKDTNIELLVCGGGRKNKILINRIKSNLSKNFNLKIIDQIGIDGDFVESQAFAFLGIRTIKNLPISFPYTTGCSKPSVGGVIVKF